MRLWRSRCSSSLKFETILPVFLIGSQCGPNILPHLLGGQWMHEQKGLQDWLTVVTGRTVSCYGNRDSPICSAAASSINTGFCELLAVFLWLLVCDVSQETQRDWIPLLWQQQEQEAQADNAGGCQAHHTKDHLMFQNIYGCSRWKKDRSQSGQRSRVTQTKTNSNEFHSDTAAVGNERSLLSAWAIHFLPCVFAVWSLGTRRCSPLTLIQSIMKQKNSSAGI